MGRKRKTETTVTVQHWGGRWWVVHFFYRDGDPTTRRREFEAFGSQDEAERVAEAQRLSIAAGRLDQLREGPCPQTIGELLDRLIAVYTDREKRADCRPRTLHWIEAISLLIRPRLGLVRLESIAADLPLSYAKERIGDGIMPRSVWAETRVLRSALLLARERGWWQPPGTATVPSMFRHLEPQHLGDLTEIHWLRADEVVPFRQAVADLGLPLFLLMCDLALHAGLRLGEVMALQWADWVKRDREISIKREKPEIGYRTKAGKARVVPVASELQESLMREWIRQGRPKPDGWMFPRGDGTRRRSNTHVALLVRRCTTAAGVTPVTFHGLRHTFASLALESGALSLVEVSRILGHSSVDFTARLYVHVSRQKLAVGTDRLAEYYLSAKPATKPANQQTVGVEVADETGTIPGR